MSLQRVDLPSGTDHCTGDVCVRGVGRMMALLVSKAAWAMALLSHTVPAASVAYITACSGD
jgi:hypothetical protein